MNEDTVPQAAVTCAVSVPLKLQTYGAIQIQL